MLNSDVDTLASTMNEVLLTTAEKVLGRRRKKIQPWVTDEVLDLCDKRQERQGKKHSSEEVRVQYQKAHREVRRKMKAAKEAWIKELCGEIDRGTQAGDSNKAYSVLKTLT